MPEDTVALFVIDGREYEIPGLETFDMDEAMILYDYSGLTLEDFAADDDVEDEEERNRKLRHPGLLKTLLHVSYQRGNPSVGKAKVSRTVGAMNLVDALKKLAEDEQVPPTEPQSSGPPTPSSSRSLNGSEPSSGADSTPSSDVPDGTPEATGTTGSDISATSGVIGSAV